MIRLGQVVLNYSRSYLLFASLALVSLNPNRVVGPSKGVHSIAMPTQKLELLPCPLVNGLRFLLAAQ